MTAQSRGRLGDLPSRANAHSAEFLDALRSSSCGANGRGVQGQDQHHKRGDGQPAARPCHSRPLRHHGMSHAAERQAEPPTSASPPRNKLPCGISARMVSRETMRCARGPREKTMCPPSSCPPGSRFRAVANIPSPGRNRNGMKITAWQAAKPAACAQPSVRAARARR